MEHERLRSSLATILVYASGSSLRIAAMRLGVRAIQHSHEDLGIGTQWAPRSRRASSKRKMLRKRLSRLLEQSCSETRMFLLRDLYVGIYTREGFRKLLANGFLEELVVGLKISDQARECLRQDLLKKIHWEAARPLADLDIDSLAARIFACELLYGSAIGSRL